MAAGQLNIVGRARRASMVQHNVRLGFVESRRAPPCHCNASELPSRAALTHSAERVALVRIFDFPRGRRRAMTGLRETELVLKVKFGGNNTKKLLRVVAAFGLILAGFVAFLLMPEGGAVSE